jgi:hypothetical protein
MTDQVRRVVASFPGLIGWYSVCLLLAAWGPMASVTIHGSWGCVGVFGLLAAIGLGRLEAARAREEDVKIDVAYAKRQVAKLGQFCPI